MAVYLRKISQIKCLATNGKNILYNRYHKGAIDCTFAASIDKHDSPEKRLPLIESYRPRWPEPTISDMKIQQLIPTRTIPDSVLRFRLKSTFEHGISVYYPHLKYHPADYKVALFVNINDLNLTKEEKIILREMVGTRYNVGKKEIKLTCERFPNRIENKRYLVLLLENLVREANTYNPDRATREAATQKLYEIEKQPGYLPVIVQIIGTAENPLGIRQAAGLRLKNLATLWSIRDGPKNPAPEPDRVFIRTHLLDAIVQSIPHPQVKALLLESAYHVIKNDFPTHWPNLVQQCVSLIQSGSVPKISAALHVLRQLTKSLQYNSKDKQKARTQFATMILPGLLSILRDAVSQASPQPEHWERMYLCCKIFAVSSILELPKNVSTAPTIGPWLEAWARVLSIAAPAGLTKPASGQWKDQVVYKAKKWAVICLQRTWQRYGRPGAVDEGFKDFADMFLRKYAIPGMQAILSMLKTAKEGAIITSRMLCPALNYLEGAVSHSSTYQVLRPHVPFVLLDVVFPAMCLTEDDLDLWESSPQEYCRRLSDVLMEGHHDPRTHAINLMLVLVKKRTRDALPVVSSSIGKIFSGTSGGQNSIQREAMVRIFGSMRRFLMADEPKQESARKLLREHVFPDLKNKTGYLRASACWTVGQYYKLTFPQPEIAAITRLLMERLKDPEQPVRLEAATAIGLYLYKKEVLELIKPHAAFIVEQFFSMAKELGNEEVIAKLGIFIEKLESDVAPFASAMANRMVAMAIDYANQPVDDEDAPVLASELVSSLATLLYAVESKPQIFPTLEPCFAPLFDQLLSDMHLDFADTLLEIMACLTFFSRPAPLSPFMWQLLLKVCAAFHDWLADYLENMMPAIDNFISRGGDFFLTGNGGVYLKAMWSIIAKVLANDERAAEAQHCCKLMQSILAHHRGKVDTLVPEILTLSVTRLASIAKSDQYLQLKFMYCDVIASAAHYNPRLFLQICAAKGDAFLQAVFNLWLSHLQHMKHSHHRKMAVLGICALLHVPVSEHPALLQKGLTNIFQEMLVTLNYKPKSKAEGKGEDGDEEEGGEGDEDGEGDDGEVYDEEEGDDDLDDDDDEEYDDTEEFDDVDESRDAMNELDAEEVKVWAQALKGGLSGGAAGMDVRPRPYANPLDNIDPFIFFTQTVETLHNSQRPVYDALMSKLGEGAKQMITSSFDEAKKRKEEAAKKEAEKKAKEAGLTA